MLTSVLRKWGGSVALPIPRKVLALAKFSPGREVEIEVKEGGIVISPTRKHSFVDLLAEHLKLKIPRDDAWIGSPSAGRELL
ncbi:MAG: AbrB/MazE/SpoVT family DNA-binding domain-containing protein [Betaproteobacteria bacterium]|nr:AbrB/MazE/SpoVT family DNA-binding domain-containing protein [Betaproteobacteria bacterium]